MPDILRKSVSASQTAGLFNQSPYITRRSLFDFLHDNIDVDEKENNSMGFGKYVQPFILKRTAEKLNLEVRPNKLNDDGTEEYIRHKDLPVGCTMDANLSCPTRGFGVIEAKSVRWQVHKEAWTPTIAPLHIELQIQTQMLVTGASWGAIAVMIGANEDFLLYERRPNPAMFERIAEEAKRMMLDVTNHNRPPVFGDEIEMKGLNQLWPTLVAGKKIEDLNDVVNGQLLLDYAQAHERQSFYEEEKKRLKTKILDVGQDASKLRFHGAGADIKKTPVSASTVMLPAEIRSPLLALGKMLAERPDIDPNSLTPIQAAIGWAKVTRAASFQTKVDVTPYPLDPAPEQQSVFLIEG